MSGDDEEYLYQTVAIKVWRSEEDKELQIKVWHLLLFFIGKCRQGWQGGSCVLRSYYYSNCCPVPVVLRRPTAQESVRFWRIQWVVCTLETPCSSAHKATAKSE